MMFINNVFKFICGAIFFCVIALLLAATSGCAMTPAQAQAKCDSYRQIIAIAQALPPNESRDSRIALYQGLYAAECASAQ